MNPRLADPAGLGQAPAFALATLYLSMAQSLSILFANLVAQQQQMAMVAQAATVQGLTRLLAAGPDRTGDALARVEARLAAVEKQLAA